MRYAIKMVGLVFVLALAACDGDGDAGADRLVGTWRASAGTVKKVCPGAVEQTETLTNDVVWSRGASSDLVSRTALTPCRLKADVSGDAAVVVPGPGCAQSDGAGGTVTVTFSLYTFAIAADGLTALENAAGQITHARGGEASSCSFVESGSYRKVDEATPSAAVR